MEKIKWKYYKDSKEWVEQHEMIDDGRNTFEIKNEGSLFVKRYRLRKSHFDTIGSFKKLSSAKTVANLLRNG